MREITKGCWICLLCRCCLMLGRVINGSTIDQVMRVDQLGDLKDWQMASMDMFISGNFSLPVSKMSSVYLSHVSCFLGNQSRVDADALINLKLDTFIKWITSK